jgi:hypothetical protein
MILCFSRTETQRELLAAAGKEIQDKQYLKHCIVMLVDGLFPCLLLLKELSVTSCMAFSQLGKIDLVL